MTTKPHTIEFLPVLPVLALFFSSLHGQGLPPNLNQRPLCEVEDVEVTTAGELASVVLIPTVATDPDGEDENLLYEWTLPFDSAASFDGPVNQNSATLQVPVGETVVTLTLTDELGLSSSCEATVTVVKDLPQPPVVTCTVDPSSLWPPNHKMTKVRVAVKASSSAAAPSELIGVCLISSSEEDSTRPGDRGGDVNGKDGYSAPVETDLIFNESSGAFEKELHLRAERFGSGAGRTYTIVCQVSDPFGQTTEDSCTVLVPHDRRVGLPAAAVRAQKLRKIREARRKAKLQRMRANRSQRNRRR